MMKNKVTTIASYEKTLNATNEWKTREDWDISVATGPRYRDGLDDHTKHIQRAELKQKDIIGAGLRLQE